MFMCGSVERSSVLPLSVLVWKIRSMPSVSCSPANLCQLPFLINSFWKFAAQFFNSSVVFPLLFHQHADDWEMA
jgi:hypothetical protein